MEDIQTWIYVIIGIVYFIVRTFRNKKPQQADKPAPATSRPQRPDIERRKPLTFEELLQEFTEGRKPEDAEEEESVIDSKDVIARRSEERKRDSFEEEGRDRRFSDDESKRIYEESIRNAEGFDLDFERDDDFKITKLESRHAEEQESEAFQASDIKEMLANPEDAKKAVILSEILGRKY